MTAADFDKKVVVITGASGGIGNAIGRAFVDCRARVICADLQPPDIDVGMLFCRTDVGDDASARALFAFAEKECGGVDVLVNCAVGKSGILKLAAEPHYHCCDIFRRFAAAA